jgi:hypothetical protein
MKPCSCRVIATREKTGHPDFPALSDWRIEKCPRCSELERIGSLVMGMPEDVTIGKHGDTFLAVLIEGIDRTVIGAGMTPVSALEAAKELMGERWT